MGEQNGRVPGPALRKPTIRELISLEVPVRVKVSPDGRYVAYLVRTTNWNENRYVRVCYVYDVGRGRSFQLTRSGNVSQMEWIDDDTLAVSRACADDADQIWLFEHLIGEGVQVTHHKTGVQSFKPFAKGVLFLADDVDRADKKPRVDKFGTLTHFEHEESASALYYVNFEQSKAYRELEKALVGDKAKELVKPVLDLSKRLDVPQKIVSFFPSPSNDTVYINCRRRDDLVYWEEASTFQLVLDPDASLQEFITREGAKKGSAGNSQEGDKVAEQEDLAYLGELTQLALPKGSEVVGVSTDGTRLLVRGKARDTMFYTQSDLWLLDLPEFNQDLADEGLASRLSMISTDLDQEILHQEWTDDGVLVSYPSGTTMEMAQLTASGEVDVFDLSGMAPLYDFHATASGVVGFVGVNAEVFPEVFVADRSPGSVDWELTQLTSFGDQISDWDLGTVETIRWKSGDGIEIEGVLRKPSGFDPSQKYPLVFVVHGGPSWFSGAFLLELQDLAYYPSVQFNQRGILVLKPNYRGSIGRGQVFKELNRDNLGLGDLEDLEGAIEFLDALGWINTSRVGCMGWSQGGYISAFVGTHSDRFRAVSVGAGIADWYTYHIANDIPDFTTHYLSSSPFRDRELYTKTAPISKIQEAKTPTLIQHGAKDQRVPLANATELYRGLREMGVDVELFVFPDMKHPITKPRENRAVMHQNLTWFSHHLLGDTLDFFGTDDEDTD
jgi:dipeptidyl aminopeptidase/acylaminoacyl peptidase